MGTESAAAVEVVRSVSVPLPQAQTFELFTARMTEFWPKDHSIGSSEIAEVVVEPRSGGRWFERGVDGSECPWGRVAAWDPPRKVVLLWQIGADWQFDPDFETEVEVTFSDDGAGRTRVDLRHCNLQRYGDSTDQMRAIFDDPSGWPGTLARFAELVSDATAHRSDADAGSGHHADGLRGAGRLRRPACRAVAAAVGASQLV